MQAVLVFPSGHLYPVSQIQQDPPRRYLPGGQVGAGVVVVVGRVVVVVVEVRVVVVVVVGGAGVAQVGGERIFGVQPEKRMAAPQRDDDQT